MTYDRNFTWSKLYLEDIKTVAEKNGFKLQQTDKIDITEIKRTSEKILKINIQKVLSKLNLMNYGHEFGEKTKFTKENIEIFLNCKAWCLDDHLIGLEIEYMNVDEITLNNFKESLEKQFNNYKIIWTQL